MARYTLHFRRNALPSGGFSYTVTRGISGGPGGAMPFTPPQKLDQIMRALEQIGFDSFNVAMLRKKLEAEGSESIEDVELNDSQLRVVGFTDV